MLVTYKYNIGIKLQLVALKLSLSQTFIQKNSQKSSHIDNHNRNRIRQFISSFPHTEIKANNILQQVQRVPEANTSSY